MLKDPAFVITPGVTVVENADPAWSAPPVIVVVTSIVVGPTMSRGVEYASLGTITCASIVVGPIVSTWANEGRLEHRPANSIAIKPAFLR